MIVKIITVWTGLAVKGQVPPLQPIKFQYMMPADAPAASPMPILNHLVLIIGVFTGSCSGLYSLPEFN